LDLKGGRRLQGRVEGIVRVRWGDEVVLGHPTVVKIILTLLTSFSNSNEHGLLLLGDLSE
jgi:hypothetical protein